MRRTADCDDVAILLALDVVPDTALLDVNRRHGRFTDRS